MEKTLRGLLIIATLVALGYAGYRFDKWKVKQYIDIPEQECIIVKTDWHCFAWKC